MEQLQWGRVLMNAETPTARVRNERKEWAVLPQSSVGGCRVTRSCAEFEPDFGRRSSFGDAGWAGHTVPDVQGHLRVHADILINGVRRHRQAS